MHWMQCEPPTGRPTAPGMSDTRLFRALSLAYGGSIYPGVAFTICPGTVTTRDGGVWSPPGVLLFVVCVLCGFRGLRFVFSGFPGRGFPRLLLAYVPPHSYLSTGRCTSVCVCPCRSAYLDSFQDVSPQVPYLGSSQHFFAYGPVPLCMRVPL